ncbi:CDP-diacylglycerol-serine O-phosphatidyltransferase [Mycoemilia scoparia]|uniref:CDP-diacylglycerol--serine O-phosphatidyltransferase n=1 Tax=Mycoemilia scoparia TaxID=417184 RepID=A0A9W8A2R0_9FUNG|nr:CDP-diacylglycerol-serine O-phosphatidyltransferase [Mycoemilia scoparia]
MSSDERVLRNRTVKKETKPKDIGNGESQPQPPPPELPKDLELPMRFSMVRSFKLADLVTLGNGISGCLAIMFAMKAVLAQNSEFLYTSFGLILLGVFFDVMDGRVARWRKSSSLLGQELDSLADLISFGLAPAVLGFACGFQNVLDVSILTYFVCCGLARLARFNATVAELSKGNEGKVKYFEGTPIPTSLVIVGLLAYGVHNGKFWNFDELLDENGNHIAPFRQAFTPDKVWGGEISVIPGYELHPLVLVYAISGSLMISRRLRIPKL